MGLKQNKVQDEQISQLHTNRQRQVFLTKMIRQAKVSPTSLPKDGKNKLLLNFSPLLERLNTILCGQYLQKSLLGLKIEDLEKIQNADPTLSSIKNKILERDSNLNQRFIIKQGILYKNSLIFDQIIPRLCLPEFLGSEIIHKLHHLNRFHLGGINLEKQFKSNFYTPNCTNIIKKLGQLCLFCRLNRNKRTAQTKHFKRVRK